MRLIRITVLLAIVIGAYYIVEKGFIENDPDKISSVGFDHRENKLESKEIPDKRSVVPLQGDTFQWMNKPVDQLEKSFGEPSRKDPSAYGYEWWMYSDKKGEYIQFGIQDNHVKSIYALGSDLSLGPAEIGQTYDAVKDQFSFKREVTYNNDSSSYTFRLSDKELQERPLVKVSDDIFLQIYFDTFTDKVSAVRMMSADILLLHRPYEIQYHGKLTEKPDFSKEQWAKIEEGAEQQIFHISNVIRSQHGKSDLAWNETVSNVAYLHSEDMAKNNYFSHYEQDGDGLKERLAAKDVLYQSAGENIAAQYPDAPAAIHGWLNSEGHREALLKDEFTHLGVGVHQLHYTQNFLQRQ